MNCQLPDRRDDAVTARAMILEPLFGSQRNPARCATPRQIAADVIGSLGELVEAAGIPALRSLYEQLHTAFQMGKPMPLDPQRCGEWPEIEAAAQCAADVRDAWRAGDATAAWRAAAAATYWHGAAEVRLRPEWLKQQAKEAADKRRAAARAHGAEQNRVQRESRRQRAIEIYRSRVWTKDEAAVEIAQHLGKTFTTVRKYLNRVTTS